MSSSHGRFLCPTYIWITAHYHTYRRTNIRFVDGYFTSLSRWLCVLARWVAFEILELFLSEKQNRGMLFECPSSHQETAMAEPSRKSRPTAVFRTKQSGA